MMKRHVDGPRAVAIAVAIALAAACNTGSRRGSVAAASARSLAELAGPATRLAARAFPAAPVPPEELAGIDGIVIGGEGWRVPDLHGRAPVLQGLREYVARGGRVLLLGYALGLVHDLGVEPQRPDLVEPFRWGFDDRAASGRARLGFELVSGRADELVLGLAAERVRAHGYFLVAGAPLCTPLCVFAGDVPQRGEVLGRLLRQCDGDAQDLTATVFARWHHGAGAVLGLGLAPDLDACPATAAAEAAAPAAVDPAARAAAEAGTAAQNGRAFVQQALRWLGGDGARPRIEYWQLPDPTPRPLPNELLVPLAREVPGAPVLAHWGVVADVHGAGRSPEQVQDDVLLPWFAAGADVLALDLVDREQGLPLPWGEHDPLTRPADYRGAPFARGWNGDGMQRLCAEAHARGTVVQALLDPPPGGDGAAARLAALRFVAREWGDVRRLADGALDGMALRRWFRDERGLALAMLQDFAPGGHMVRMGEAVPTLAGAVAALDARDGRPRDATAAGLAAGFRDGFPGDLYPVGYLDCTTRRLPPRVGVAGASGGTFGDWIAIQAADFARARRGTGGAMLWRADQDGPLPPLVRRYVQGVSAEPLVAAWAARCTTIGRDGWRAAQAELLADPQPGFGAVLSVPAATVVLANNHLRLCGSGGALVLDPGGIGRFDGAGAVQVAGSFFRTRFFGGRPDAEELRAPSLDLLASGRRGEGGYEAVFTGVPQGSVPMGLAFAAAPRWPQRVELPIGTDTGQYEVLLAAHAIAGRGVLAIGLDGDVLSLVPFEDGRQAPKRTIALHQARTAHRSLTLEVLDGGAVAIDQLVVRRTGDVAAEADVVLPAGSLAIVRERSTSTYHAETVELSAIAYCPAILLRASCERAVRSLQQERRFGLAHHRTLRASTGEDPDELRRPFVLAADDPALPDLAVVPLQLARYQHFRLDAGELVLVDQPEPGTQSLIGFMLLPRGEAQAALPHLGQVFAAFDRPMALQLGDGGTADLHSDLPLPWTRVVAVAQPARTPFLVRENGWWTWRGTQDGGDRENGSLLRVTHLPGDVVRIVGGQSLLVRTRPGPGALHTVALRDAEATAVTARVLQPSPLATPCVVMGDDFDEAFLDGRPWAFHSGRTVYLPNRAGTWRVEVRRHGGDAAPHVLATRAILEHCAFDPALGELVLVVAAAADRPTELPFTAVLAGPRPTAIDGGELVDEKELRHADAGDRAAAERGGTAIRFRPGIVKVRYGK